MGNTYNILVIENDSKTLDLITETLEKLGTSVFTATSADLGLSMAKKIKPSLILVNLATPGTNGLEICKKLQGDEHLEKVPIFLLTLREGKFDHVYTKLYGIRGFLKKPLQSSALLSAIKKFISIEGLMGRDEYISKEMSPPAQEGLPQSDAAPTGEEPEKEIPEAMPEAALSEAGHEMALPDELKEDLIEARPEEAPQEESLLETGAETLMPDEEPEEERPEDKPEMATPDEEPEAASPEFEFPDEEPETAKPEFDLPDEEPEEELHEEELPEYDRNEKEQDFEELLTEETTGAKVQPEIKAAATLKKKPKLSKKILIPVMLLPLLIVIAFLSYIFVLPEAPKPQTKEHEKTVLPKTPEQADLTIPEKGDLTIPEKGDLTIPEVTVGPDAKTMIPMPAEKKEPVAAKEAPKPEAEKKVKKPVKPKPTTTYHVQFGIFKSERNAKKLVKQLKRIGLDTSIKTGRFKNGALSYGVLLDKEFKSLAQARSRAIKIKKTKRVNTFAYSEKA